MNAILEALKRDENLSPAFKLRVFTPRFVETDEESNAINSAEDAEAREQADRDELRREARDDKRQERRTDSRGEDLWRLRGRGGRVMARHKDMNWNLAEGKKTATGTVHEWDAIKVALLMDIRDELKALNSTLGCFRVRRMCDDINRIDRRLQKNLPLRKKGTAS